MEKQLQMKEHQREHRQEELDQIMPRRPRQGQGQVRLTEARRLFIAGIMAEFREKVGRKIEKAGSIHYFCQEHDLSFSTINSLMKGNMVKLEIYLVLSKIIENGENNE